MHRRRLLSLSLLASLGTVATAPANSRNRKAAGGSAKKGYCIWNGQDGWDRKLTTLNPKWYYTWGANIPRDTPRDIPFVPMIKKYQGTPDSVLDPAKAAQRAGSEVLLGFNEPDRANQADMTVAEAIAAWPILEKTKLRLGSPVTVHPDNDWMQEFMKEAEKRKYRIDFICVHSYSGPDADKLVQRMEQVSKLYKRPVWLTEFAVGDWNARDVSSNRHRPETILEYMKDVLPALEKSKNVERFAWFNSAPDNRALGTSALFDEQGNLTPLGEFYRDF